VNVDLSERLRHDILHYNNPYRVGGCVHMLPRVRSQSLATLGFGKNACGVRRPSGLTQLILF
jgi:hypothetical protein